MAADEPESVYITQLKDMLYGLDNAASYSQKEYGNYSANRQGNNPTMAELSKQQVISLATTWASIAGIYEGLTGDNQLRNRYSINSWTDGSIPGFENAKDIYTYGIITGKELSIMIKAASEVVTVASDNNPLNAQGETVYGFSNAPRSGGRGRNMRGGAPEAAKHAMTLAIITGLGFSAASNYSPLPAATMTVYSNAKNYLIQLAYGMRVITPGCMTPTATFWNSVMVSILPNGALDSCIEIARKNEQALVQLRNVVVAGFNTLLAALTASGLVIGRGQFLEMYNFIKEQIASPICDIIGNVATNSVIAASSASSMTARSCRSATRDVGKAIRDLMKFAQNQGQVNDVGPINDGGEVLAAALDLNTVLSDVTSPQGSTPAADDVSTEESAPDAEVVSPKRMRAAIDDPYLSDIRNNPQAMNIILKLQQQVRNTQSSNIVNAGGRRKTKRKWSKKYRQSINCKNPKGFSQKQYCKYTRKKKRKQNTKKYR
jgi:hypothetical protein